MLEEKSDEIKNLCLSFIEKVKDKDQLVRFLEDKDLDE